MNTTKMNDVAFVTAFFGIALVFAANLFALESHIFYGDYILIAIAKDILFAGIIVIGIALIFAFIGRYKQAEERMKRSRYYE